MPVVLCHQDVLTPVLEELELYDIGFSPSLAEGIAMDPPAADLQSLFDALSNHKEPQGRLRMVECHVRKYHDRPIDITLDMVGRWDGQFHVVEGFSGPYLFSDSSSYYEGSDESWLDRSTEVGLYLVDILTLSNRRTFQS